MQSFSCQSFPELKVNDLDLYWWLFSFHSRWKLLDGYLVNLFRLKCKMKYVAEIQLSGDSIREPEFLYIEQKGGWHIRNKRHNGRQILSLLFWPFLHSISVMGGRHSLFWLSLFVLAITICSGHHYLLTEIK